jgi:hypothetical protein
LQDRGKTAAPREHGDDVAGGHVVQPRGGLVEEEQRGRLVTVNARMHAAGQFNYINWGVSPLLCVLITV